MIHFHTKCYNFIVSLCSVDAFFFLSFFLSVFFFFLLHFALVTHSPLSLNVHVFYVHCLALWVCCVVLSWLRVCSCDPYVKIYVSYQWRINVQYQQSATIICNQICDIVHCELNVTCDTHDSMIHVAGPLPIWKPIKAIALFCPFNLLSEANSLTKRIHTCTQHSNRFTPFRALCMFCFWTATTTII